MLRTILLPYPSFRQSVACYSDNTLIQTLQKLFAFRGCLNKNLYDIRWNERDIWLFWSKWKQAYIRLAMMCTEEATSRNIPYDHEGATRLFRAKRGKHWRKPLWIGWNHLHSNHRAALLQFGEVERISRRIIKWEKLEGASRDVQDDCVFDWFEAEGFTGLYDGEETYIAETHSFLNVQGAPSLGDEYPNHYAQFNWTECPNGNITAIPPDPEDSWICRV